MDTDKMLKGLGICVCTALLASCSTRPAKTSEVRSYDTYQINNTQINKNSPAIQNKPKKLTEPKSKRVKKPVSMKRVRATRKVSNIKKIAARQHKIVNKRQVIRTAKVPQHSSRYATLKGDYADNPRTLSFIKMMNQKHGFDRGYLNYLFSHTKVTPFLKRMAYADAHPRKKDRAKPRKGRWSRYRKNFITEKTISKGVAFWRNNRIALKQAENRYGVPQEYILGIIGVETRYGDNVGKNRAIDALAAMGFNNDRRGKYFQSELESYLIMTRRAHLNPLKPMSSYAGALGLCQFMPSNIKRYGVDHDRNGVVNLWTPQDAIGSVANYFKKHGWRTGGTVAVPANFANSGYKLLKTGFKSSHSLTHLRKRGIAASHLGNITGKASLIKLDTYAGDELWLGGKNFRVITRYNHSSHYAMAVHQLAQAIKNRMGGRGILRQASLDLNMKSVY